MAWYFKGPLPATSQQKTVLALQKYEVDTRLRNIKINISRSRKATTNSFSSKSEV